ncbi:CoA-transferase family III domain-containing protein, partial [Hyaloraphidium curvatum]
MPSAPENVREDSRRAAEAFLRPLVAGGAWLGKLRRDAAEPLLPAPLATEERINELLGLVTLEGTTRPWLPTPFRITPFISGIHMAIAVLANLIAERRGISPQPARLDTDHATTSLAGHFAVEQNGLTYGGVFEKDLAAAKAAAAEAAAKGQAPTSDGGAEANPGVMYYLWNQTFTCRDGRAIFLYQKWDSPTLLLKTIGFPDSEIPGLLALCDPGRSTAEDRMTFYRRLGAHIRANWDSWDLERFMTDRKVAALMVPRSRKEFEESPHGQAVAWRPPLEFGRADGPPPVPFTPLREPERGILAGIRVVELTRALMGSRIGTVLGYLGATVVKATSPDLQDFGILSAAHNLGKLSIFLDLKKGEDKEKLRKLVRGADVFIQNYAVGACERLGFGSADVFKMVEGRGWGIVYVEGSAFGFSGPQATAPGFEHLAQAISGMAHAQGIHHAFDPEPEGFLPASVPINVLDKATGHVGAIGAMVALLRRADEGGNWLVRTALAQVAVFLQEFGAYDGLEVLDPAARKRPETRNHWLQTEVWPRYPKETLEPDPDSYFFYLGIFMEQHMKKGHPASFSPRFFDYYADAPFGSCKILKPPLWRGFARTPISYRIPPRPIGYDEVVDSWEEAERKSREIERTMKKVDFETLPQ